ncbi:ATP-dependent helicase HrpB [Donghicola tyrosinivorans]|uniref:ATP-dependent helicase HrpB n=1 Tax=Donghicola tyrosinivorans TaxID=1652492 RepID=A0A2T0X0N8_9RHOB|nr:ATP-dependent helicase HrpB [Donghicola tyrosinivorans]PRY92500.1 ATP-dependent helicase HrpB [Donghicola tyrosinivorans]
MTRLPIHDALDELISALRTRGRAVLQAPPGAGKTTVVPLAMLEAGLTKGRIVMLEPRRLAARAAAERMAETLGESVGQTVGYRVRGESKVGKDTRIEVVTEGILTRRLQNDPELAGVGAVIFDEFHERSLNADLGLALCLEVAGALRDDLILVAMSATLDAEPVATLMDAPMVTSEGRSYPVETRWLDRPLGPKARIPEATADLVAQAVAEAEGGVLVFLPGEGEIRRVEGLLSGRLPSDCQIRPLFGAMEFAAQRAAIQPATSGRKVVLATSIAETSLTIQDIRVVVDAGRARRSRFDPSSGMSQLVTERVTRAEATQRAGRAGRVAEGICYRLWTKGEEGGMQPFPLAEIESADLSGLALELAQWGADPADLPLLSQPNAGSYAEAVQLLKMLGALDDSGRITPHGAEIARLPLHPRLAHMLIRGGKPAAPLAALLADRDVLRGAPVDLSLRVEALQDLQKFLRERPYQPHRPSLERVRQEQRRLSKSAPDGMRPSMAQMAALAYPDRIGARRKGDTPRYLLSGGSGAIMASEDPMASAPFIVATDLDGDRKDAKIRQAIQISAAELRELYEDRIAWVDSCEWSDREKRVVARSQERFGAIALQDRIWKDPSDEAVSRAMLAGVRQLGLPWSDAARRFAARVTLARAEDPDLPSVAEADLLERAEDWLLPYLQGVKTAQHWKNFDLLPPLRSLVDYNQTQHLDRSVPAHFTTPLGRKIPIDYSGEAPEIQLRLQELFGQTTHPTVAGTPLRVTLLSPAQRPVQTTMDIPGFWDSSYADVRKDMRGRYPKHPWPEDPRQADPTLRAKPRG